MLRPFWLDLAIALLPVLAGLLSFMAGGALRRLSAPIFRLILALVVCGVVLVGIALCSPLADPVGAWLHTVGGTLAVTCTMALLWFKTGWPS